MTWLDKHIKNFFIFLKKNRMASASMFIKRVLAHLLVKTFTCPNHRLYLERFEVNLFHCQSAIFCEEL